jgi:hypothetical protein
MNVVFKDTSYNHYLSLPRPDDLFNPLMDVDPRHREDNEMIEFYKLSNQLFSPEFGASYILNCPLYPFQMSALRAVLNHKFPMLLFSRGGGKTFMLALIAVYYAVMFPDSRIILISGTFRQAKLIFREIIRIYRNAALLRSIADKEPVIGNDNCNFYVHGSSIIGLPLGAGDKIRGERGHIILVDEFDSISKEVFDVVIRGFGATQADPWEKTRSILLRLKKLKSTTDKASSEISSIVPVIDSASSGNKIVISGTAGHKIGPFYKLYSHYLKIIGNKIQGSLSQYQHVFDNEDEIDPRISVDFEQYCIISYKYRDLPVGMMDTQMIHNARATMSKMYFSMEYECEFADDTTGFFKYRDIYKATAKHPNAWYVTTSGDAMKQYVMGVDPARTIDRFAIIVIQIGPPHKIVYAWSSKKQRYDFSVTRMWALMKIFNIVGIGLDTGGGGLTVKDMLEEPKDPTEKPIIAYDVKEAKANDRKILYPFNWNPVWIEEANVLLQKNLESGQILFPAENLTGVVKNKTEFKTLDAATDEINKLKRELVSIEVSYSSSGTKKFNLKPPNIKSEPGESITHKDRYSALLLANYVASKIGKIEPVDPLEEARKGYEDPGSLGGWFHEFK